MPTVNAISGDVTVTQALVACEHVTTTCSDATPELIAIPATAQPWHCAICGTVTRCAMQYMRCDEPYSARDVAPPAGVAWLRELGKQHATEQ